MQVVNKIEYNTEKKSRQKKETKIVMVEIKLGKNYNTKQRNT